MSFFFLNRIEVLREKVSCWISWLQEELLLSCLTLRHLLLPFWVLLQLLSLLALHLHLPYLQNVEEPSTTLKDKMSPFIDFHSTNRKEEEEQEEEVKMNKLMTVKCLVTWLFWHVRESQFVLVAESSAHVKRQKFHLRCSRYRHSIQRTCSSSSIRTLKDTLQCTTTTASFYLLQLVRWRSLSRGKEWFLWLQCRRWDSVASSHNIWVHSSSAQRTWETVRHL